MLRTGTTESTCTPHKLTMFLRRWVQELTSGNVRISAQSDLGQLIPEVKAQIFSLPFQITNIMGLSYLLFNNLINTKTVRRHHRN